MSDSKSSMGDLFMQRRAAARTNNATAGPPPANAADGRNAAGGGGTKKSSSSFADIQREQQRESQPGSGSSSSGQYGGGPGGGQFGGRPQQQQQQRGGGQLYGEQQQQKRGGGGGGGGQYGNQRGGGHQQQQQQQQGRRGVDADYGRLQRPSDRNNNDTNHRRRDDDDDDRRNASRRGGPDRRRGSGFDHPRADHRNKASLPLEQGVIHTLLDKFGFIACADRDRELFFHYSEYEDGYSAEDLNIGDEVEFRVGRAEERGGGGGGGRRGGGGGEEGGGGGNEKMSAFGVKKLPEGTIYWEKEDEPKGKRHAGRVERVAREERQGGGRDRGRSREGGGGTGAQDGMIRIVGEDDGDGDGDEGTNNDDCAGDGLEIHFSPSDFKSAIPGHARLDRHDLVEFTLVTMRRTGKKYARDIALVKSERERQREERERKMLESAPLERGVVARMNNNNNSNNGGGGGRNGGGNKGDGGGGEYGFLRSANRMEEVHFGVAHVLASEDGGENGDKAATLKEGQEVEFYVITETNDSGGGRQRGANTKSLTARKIRLLPKGTVKFEHVLAKGVTGMVVECPLVEVKESSFFGGGRREDGRRGGDNRGGSGGNAGGGGGSPVVGKIRLEHPITVMSDDNGDSKEQQVITQVSLHPTNYPGGTYALSRTGSETGSWIRPHDTLLFDVVQKVLDGSVWAMPTSATHPNEKTAAEGGSNSAARVRLIEPSLCTRTSGVVRSVHDNYGFISLSEREGADAYFPLFEVFPGEVHGDLISNEPELYGSDRENGGKGDDGYGGLVQFKGGRINIEVGAEVMLDLSLQAPPPNSGGRNDRGDRGGRYKQSNNRSVPEKESYRARRVQILPKGTIVDKMPIASGVKATVIKVDGRQPHVGTLELEDSLKVDIAAAREKRHPYVVKLLDDIATGKYGSSGEEKPGVVFHDILSDKESQVVISMVNVHEDLEWSYVDPEENGKDDHGRRLCITRMKGEDEKVESVDEPAIAEAPLAVSEASTASAAVVENEAATAASDEKQETIAGKKKSKKATNKVLRMLRFDKLSFLDVESIGGPLGAGDVLTCDVYQSRQTGLFLVENITVVERNAVHVVSEGEPDATKMKDLVGLVSETVAARQFGFIAQVFEEEERVSKKRGDHVFFHFREVVADPGANSGSEGDAAKDGKNNPPQSSLASRSPKKFGRSRSNSVAAAALYKGDEVKFDIIPEGKNGKPTAVNVRILPHGTLKLPAKAPPMEQCTGYILMEPSHTSMANTPSHTVASPGSGPAAAAAGGRWANVQSDRSAHKAGSNVKAEGVILLLSDPSHLFSVRPTRKKAEESSPSKGENDAAPAEGEPVAESTAGAAGGSTQTEPNDAGKDDNNTTDTEKTKDEASADKSDPQSLVGTHLRYKLSSIISSRGGGQAPKRGDLVTFGKARGASLIKEIRIGKMGAAANVRGTLVDISTDGDGSAVFVVSDEERYEVRLTEVVSCDKLLLKDKEQVDGILHEGKIFGVCRTKDVYLASSFGRNSSGGGSSISSVGTGAAGGKKERPRLNLTVKKELRGMGGAIMAQSGMAKGPDGTDGFVAGWTKRESLYVVATNEDDVLDEMNEDFEAMALLSAAASEFVPNFSIPDSLPPIAASGFEAVDGSEEVPDFESGDSSN